MITTALSKTAAIKQATREVDTYRLGNDWALSQYSARFDAWVKITTGDFYKIREGKRRAIVTRALELLGWSAEDAEIEAETLNDQGAGGSASDQVERALKFRARA